MKEKIKKILRPYYFRMKFAGKAKIFCVGRNKTGTRSLIDAISELGIREGNQRQAELLNKDWGKRDFRRIIEHCYTAESFKDVPFSWPYTYVILDHHFPNSKFILTVRDNSEQWYNSITKFHGKKWGKDGRVPTKEDLQNATYRNNKGMPWENNRMIFDTPEDEPYKKETLIAHYESHNKAVLDYFRHRPEDLLVINVAEKGSYGKLCNFLGVKSDKTEFPWKNKTSEKKQEK